MNAPSSSTPHFPEIAALSDTVKAMLLQKSSPPASVKAVEEICVSCGGSHPYHQCLATDGNAFPEYQDNIQRYVSAIVVNYNQGNTGYHPQNPCQTTSIRTARALIDVYGEEFTLRVDDEAITFKYAQESARFSDSQPQGGNPTPSLDPILSTSSPSLTPFEEGDFILEEIEAFINDDPTSPLPPKELHVEELKIIKSSIDDPPELELKDLPSQKKKWVLSISIFRDKEYHRFNISSRYEMFAYRDACLFGYGVAPGTFQRCMMAIFHDMIEETMEIFMNDLSVFEDSFSSCLSHLDKLLKWCEDTNLVLNWEKCHFMVKEGIVPGHKISKSKIEANKAKVDVFAKLPHPTSIKGVRSFLGHAGFYH
ncbi:reverse transcriptase domain-containing protein [Tanacetum coccineum]